MSDEYMSGPRLGSHLSLCPGGTYTSPADRAYDCFANCTRYARYFAFPPPTCSAHPPENAPPHCRTAPKSCSVSQERATPPAPPHEKHRRGSPSVHPKRLPGHSRRWPVHPNLSPTVFEGFKGEFRWHLRSDIEVRRVGQAIPGLEIFCGGWQREARQDVGVRVCVLRSVLYRKSVRIQEVDPSLYAIALV